MVGRNEKSRDVQIVDAYRTIVERRHADKLAAWPILSGFNSKAGAFAGWLVVILKHTGNPTMRSFSGLGDLSEGLLGVQHLDNTNKTIARTRLIRHFGLSPSDAIVFVDPSGDISEELNLMLQRHEFAMGLTPMKIFLSHKGADKPVVRDYRNTLELLGFDPWLDEDAMAAGTELERGLLRGFADSCAAVFFITPNYKDESYLASEVDYAIQEKRKKGDRFAIITLVLHEAGAAAKVPDLLARYVWKTPATHLEGLREIIKALPVYLAQVYWRP